jgi:hypothetical protein
MADKLNIVIEITSFFEDWLKSHKKKSSGKDLCQLFGISIEISANPPRRGNLVLRSEYSGNPPKITVYEKSLQSWWEQIKKKKGPGSLTKHELTDICILHEFFHHLLLYPACFYPQCFLNDVKNLKRSEEEKIVHSLVKVWLTNKYPSNHTEMVQILGL